MLQKLLAEIRSGGTFEVSDLAARLGTTPALVQAMLEHLQRAGQLSAIQTGGCACGMMKAGNSKSRCDFCISDVNFIKYRNHE